MVHEEKQEQSVFMVRSGTRLSSCFRQESGGKTSLVLPDSIRRFVSEIAGSMSSKH